MKILLLIFIYVIAVYVAFRWGQQKEIEEPSQLRVQAYYRSAYRSGGEWIITQLITDNVLNAEQRRTIQKKLVDHLKNSYFKFYN